MGNSFTPAIVVSAYNRSQSLKRILKSIANASYSRSNIPLVISIDKSDNAEVIKIARDFEWLYGDKRIIEHPSNLGLRNHILKCGDLTEEYGSIILLEDDLYVSPYFYNFTEKALSFYENRPGIGGISLYSHRYNETSFMRFTPVRDLYDTYFMQIPSSWGQAWTSEQWRGFRSWYDQNHTQKIGPDDIVPPNVVLWPETSWKKYYFKYIIEKKLFFVYPYLSLTSNFADVGTHHVDNRTCLQEPLQRVEIDYKFSEFDESSIIYDSHCELSEVFLKKLSPSLEKYDLEVDLYGRKDHKKIKKEYVITTKEIEGQAIKSFGRQFKPHEMNIAYNNPGDVFYLVKTEQVIASPHSMINSNRNSYYYDIPEFFLLKDNLRTSDQVSTDARILKSYHDFNLLKETFSYRCLKFLFDFEIFFKSKSRILKQRD